MFDRCASLFGQTVTDSFPMQEGGFENLDARAGEGISDSLELIGRIE